MKHTCIECGKEFEGCDARIKWEGIELCRSCHSRRVKIQKYGSIEEYNRQRAAKRKKTCLERYGVDVIFKSDEFKEKSKATNLRLRGVENVSQSEEVKKKREQTFIDKFGANNPWKSEEVKAKIRTTNIERYGDPVSSRNPGVKLRQKLTRKAVRNSEEHLNKRIEIADRVYGLELVDKDIREDGETILTYRCKTCGNELIWCQADDTRHPYCRVCHSKRSQGEKEVFELVSKYTAAIHNDRSVIEHFKELDINIPEKHVAIEYDGIFWHDGIDNYYKYKSCRDKGIRLIQITDYEWYNKREIIISIIRSLFNDFDKRIYARSCEVKHVDSIEAREFLTDNHLQGPINTSINIGLYYNNELVQLCTFGKSRFSKDYEYELIRECSKLNYNIIGGKSRILSHFITEYDPSSIVSYCEKNKFSGISYERCGFKLIKETAPGYKYYKDDKEYSRITFQKYKMPGLVGTLLTTYDSELTEFENMELNEYRRIYDYGNYVYVWIKPQI